jgi:hypothetical protein
LRRLDVEHMNRNQMIDMMDSEIDWIDYYNLLVRVNAFEDELKLCRKLRLVVPTHSCCFVDAAYGKTQHWV